MLRKILSLIVIVVLLSAISVAAAPSEWAVEEINKARNLNLVPQNFSTQYQLPITREQFSELVILLYEEFGGVVPEGDVSPFLDTDNESVLAAYKTGIVFGVGEGLFAPLAPITRQEICVMLSRMLEAGSDKFAPAEKYPNTFPDVNDIADWALVSVQYINMKGVMYGDENGNINPLANTTVEQAIVLCYRLYNTLMMELSDEIAAGLFQTSGNSHSNMLNGGFANVSPSGNIYTATKNGIKNVSSGQTVSDAPAKNLYIYKDSFLYINSDDGRIYSNSGGVTTPITEDRAAAFIVYADFIYYVNESKDGRIYKTSIESEGGEIFFDAPSSLPVAIQNAFYFSDGEKIQKLSADGTVSTFYEGTNYNLTSANGTLYFLNAIGLICSVSEGEEAKILTTVPAAAFCPASNYLVFTGWNGYVYKVDFSGKSTVRIDEGSYSSINTHGRNVYAKTDGEVYLFNLDSVNKMKIS